MENLREIFADPTQLCPAIQNRVYKIGGCTSKQQFIAALDNPEFLDFYLNAKQDIEFLLKVIGGLRDSFVEFGKYTKELEDQINHTANCEIVGCWRCKFSGTNGASAYQWEIVMEKLTNYQVEKKDE